MPEIEFLSQLVPLGADWDGAVRLIRGKDLDITDADSSLTSLAASDLFLVDDFSDAAGQGTQSSTKKITAANIKSFTDQTIPAIGTDAGEVMAGDTDITSVDKDALETSLGLIDTNITIGSANTVNTLISGDLEVGAQLMVKGANADSKLVINNTGVSYVDTILEFQKGNVSKWQMGYDSDTGHFKMASGGFGVGADLELDTAGNLSIAGDMLLAEDKGIIFEGDDTDDYETRLLAIGPSADIDVFIPNASCTLVGDSTTNILTNKTLASPVLTTGVSGSAVLHDDTFATATATTIATSESIKAYVDNTQYESKICNFSATILANYLPLGGHMGEKASQSGAMEYIGFMAPFNGTLERIVLKSTYPQSGAMRINLMEGTGTDSTADDEIGRFDETLALVGNAVTIVDFIPANLTTGYIDNALVKGEMYAILLTLPDTPRDCIVTAVFKWDITS